jgi:hypothetical protein
VGVKLLKLLGLLYIFGDCRILNANHHGMFTHWQTLEAEAAPSPKTAPQRLDVSTTSPHARNITKPRNSIGVSTLSRVKLVLSYGVVWVSVVVVVTGAGTVVCCVVVVEVCEVLSVSQPVSVKSAAVAKQVMIIFFINMILVWFVVLPVHKYIVGPSWAIRCNPTPYSSVRMNLQLTPVVAVRIHPELGREATLAHFQVWAYQVNPQHVSVGD